MSLKRRYAPTRARLRSESVRGFVGIGSAETVEAASLFQPTQEAADEELSFEVHGLNRPLPVPYDPSDPAIPYPVFRTEFVTQSKRLHIKANWDQGTEKGRVVVKLPTGFDYQDHGISRHSVNHGEITSSELYDEGREFHVEAECSGGDFFNRYRGWVDVTVWLRGRREVEDPGARGLRVVPGTRR